MQADRQKRLHRTISLFYLTSFLSNFRLNAPILIIYLQQQTGSLTTAMSLLAFLMIGASILDIPTGALADIFGRKNTLALSWLFGLVHLSLLAIGGSYGVLLLSMLAASAGMALGSGANTALLYDSLREVKREEDYKKINGRANGLLTLALGTAAPLGSYLASFSLSLPFWVQLLPQSVGFLLTLMFVEPSYSKPLHNNVAIHSLLSAKVILVNKQLLLLLLINAFSFAIGETVAVITPKWYQTNIPLPYIGIAFTGVYVLSSLGFFFADAMSTKYGDIPILFISTLYSLVVMLVATLLVGPLLVVLAVSTSFFYGIRWPILDFMIHQQVDSHQRATVGSFGGVLQRGLSALLAILVGILADRLGVVKAIQLATLLLGVNVVSLFFLKSSK